MYFFSYFVAVAIATAAAYIRNGFHASDDNFFDEKTLDNTKTIICNGMR